MLFPNKSCWRSYGVMGIKNFHQKGNYKLSLYEKVIPLVVLVVFSCFQESQGVLRYTEQSCADLVPRNVDQYKEPNDFSQFFGFDTWQGNRNRYRQLAKRKRDQYAAADEPPFKIGITERRYRRNTDLVVRIEGGDFDGLMLQSRIAPGGEVLRGGVGLLGSFRYLPYLFEYSPCFGLPHSTVVDKGRPVKLGNVSFTWTAPDTEAGDIRFIASVLRGIHYWIIPSNILKFNPFPISTYACGSSLACFRVCSSGGYPCMARHSLYIFSYSVDFRDKREIEFTIGGRLTNNKSYIAVAFGDDFHKLVQADMTACYLERGRARLAHLLIENLQLAYQHTEIIELDDYDIDGNMLWCRFRRPVNPSTIINPRLPLYHFYFSGTIDTYYQRFNLPPRHKIYNSAFKRNLSTPFNEILSGAVPLSGSLKHMAFVLSMLIGFLNGVMFMD